MTKIYLDLNAFGTPNWLSPIGKFDRTQIRKYHRERWLESRVMRDANPNRWPAGSPDSKGGEFAPKGMGAKSDWIREKIDAVADKMHFPRERIHMSTGTYMFTLNGNQHRAGGIAINSPNGYTQPDTGEKFGMGDIVIYGDAEKGFEEDMPIRPLVAHEIQHQIYNQVNARAKEEGEHMARHNPGVVNGTFTYEESKEKFGKTYPTWFAITDLKLQSNEVSNKLEEEDGVTWYSKQYWDQHDKEKYGSFELAVNETLAEIASLTEAEEARIWDKNTFGQMTEHLRDWLKSSYEKEGSSFADPDEHASQMADPWAYAEMMEDTDGDDAFRKKFGTKLHNIRGLGADGLPKYYRPIFTEYPDPVISPLWQKVYNTYQQEYRRIHNITDAGFDPSQPRDKEGQWTGGVLKLGKKMRTIPTSREGWPSTQATHDLYETGYINPMNDREIVWSQGDNLAMLEFGSAHDEQTIYLKHIRTFPQRKGFGRKAMQELQRRASEKGLGIWLEVARNSDTPFKVLKKFYTSLGFDPAGEDEMIWRPKN